MVLGGNDREGCGDWEGIPGKMPPHVTPLLPSDKVQTGSLIEF